MFSGQSHARFVRSVSIWAVLLAFSSFGLYILLNSMPEDREVGPVLEILPTNLKQLQQFHESLVLYASRHRIPVLVSFSSVYIFKQAFSIPGSVLLNLIAGVIFDLWIAVPLVCVLCTFGASGAYWQSYFLGKDVIEYWMPKRLHQMQRKITTQKMGLLPYLIFIRLFPFTPNWFINMACPILSVPYFPFAFSVFIGLMPYNFVTTQAGNLITELNSTKEVFSIATITKLLVCSLIVLSFPVIKSFVIPRVKELYEDSVETDKEL